MSNHEPTANDDTDSVGYKKTPKHTRWQKGQSGNRKGRPKKRRPMTLKNAIANKLKQSAAVVVEGKTSRITAKQLIVRKLVESAAVGELRALIALIKLSEMPGGRNPDPRSGMLVLDYDEARAACHYREMDEAFFQKQEKEWADCLKAYRSGDASIPVLIERELARKVPATRDGKAMKVTMLEVIVLRFLNDGYKGDMGVIKLLLQFAPSAKIAKFDRGFYVMRPTPEDLEKIAKFEVERVARSRDMHLGPMQMPVPRQVRKQIGN